jgi:hypothetical protein
LYVDSLLDLCLAYFKGLIAFELGFEIAGLEVVKEGADFGSFLFDLVFEVMPLNFLSGLFVFGEKLLW